MNLVAKEFVSSREDEDGVLVLSELTGAAGELQEALTVNPYSVDDLVDTMVQALEMDREERRSRMAALRLRTSGHTVHNWADRFTSDISAATTGCLNRPAAAAETIRAAIERGARVARPALRRRAGAGRAGRLALRPGSRADTCCGSSRSAPGITVHLVSGFDHD